MKGRDEGARTMLRMKWKADAHLRHTYLYTYIYPHTCVAHRICNQRACCLGRAVGTTVVCSACRAVIIFGIERLADASRAFCGNATDASNVFLARSALGD